MSGAQIWIGRKPCWRSLSRCALTLSRDDLDGVRARNYRLQDWLHVTYHNFLPTSSQRTVGHFLEFFSPGCGAHRPRLAGGGWQRRAHRCATQRDRLATVVARCAGASCPRRRPAAFSPLTVRRLRIMLREFANSELFPLSQATSQAAKRPTGSGV